MVERQKPPFCAPESKGYFGPCVTVDATVWDDDTKGGLSKLSKRVLRIRDICMQNIHYGHYGNEEGW